MALVLCYTIDGRVIPCDDTPNLHCPTLRVLFQALLFGQMSYWNSLNRIELYLNVHTECLAFSKV